jgi:hypothetical protein
MLTRLAKRLQLLAFSALLASCAPQAEPGYQGEPLFTIQGQVAATPAASSPQQLQLDAALLWQRGAPPATDDQELATRARIISGPESFTLHLYQPPPAAALRALAPGEPAYARAIAAAVPTGIAFGAGPITTLPTAANAGYGLDNHHWILYFPADVRPGSLTEWWLGESFTAGFHLVRVAGLDPKCISTVELNACVSDLLGRGVPDDGTANPGMARFFCLEPYRITPAPGDERLLLTLGAAGLEPVGGTCP